MSGCLLILNLSFESTPAPSAVAPTVLFLGTAPPFPARHLLLHCVDSYGTSSVLRDACEASFTSRTFFGVLWETALVVTLLH